jgi:hypothetical protein
MKGRRSVERKCIWGDANYRAVFLVVEQVVDVAIAGVSLPEEWPAAELVRIRAGVRGKRMEIDTVDTRENYLEIR